MSQEKTYTQSELLEMLSNLENFIQDTNSGIPKGEVRMPKRKQEKVLVNGQIRWISGYSMQELFDAYVNLLEREGVVQRTEVYGRSIPLFGEYLKIFVKTYKDNQASLTKQNRDQIIRNHILPRFGKIRITDISTTDLQTWFNELSKKYAKETILKIKSIMSPAFDAAVEEDILTRNPLKSTRIEISGKETVHHKAIPKEKMDIIRNELPLMDEREKRMLALLCFTGMRFEEVLGCKWLDFDSEWIHISRAVVHPKRNLPEIKDPKTFRSKRIIPYPKQLKDILGDNEHGFLLYSLKDQSMETPLSYTEARRMFNKIRKRFNLDGYSAHDFRDTCATEWREAGMPIDVIARLLGHTKTETTEKRYIKYRKDILDDARRIIDAC